MSRPSLTVLLLLATTVSLTTCGRTEGRCVSPHASDANEDTSIVVATCEPRGVNEWAAAPAGAAMLVPEAIELWPDGKVAEVIVLTAGAAVMPVDSGPTPPRTVGNRLTFRVGLTDGSVTLVGIESVDAFWFDAHVRGIERDVGLERLLVCRSLPDGSGVLRLVPSRPSEGPMPDLPSATPYPAALRRRDAAGAEIGAYTLWAPDRDDDGWMCGRRLVWFEPSGRLTTQCTDRSLDGECPRCLPEMATFERWRCTGEGADGLLFCEPPP